MESAKGVKRTVKVARLRGIDERMRMQRQCVNESELGGSSAYSHQLTEF
jgi:hypothetical protein